MAKLTESQQSSDWASVLIEVTTSEIKTVDCIVSFIIEPYIVACFNVTNKI